MNASRISLRRYRAMFANAPRPTPDQIEDFVEYAAGMHSWYKRLPLFGPGTPFVFCLGPLAGMKTVTYSDGSTEVADIAEDEPRWHYATMPTAIYRARFGFLMMVDGENPMVSARDDVWGGELVRFRVPEAIANAGRAHLTAVVHAHAGAAWLWEDHFARHPDAEPTPWWPAESGGRSIPHAIRILVQHRHATPDPGDGFSFRPPIDALVAPERHRQRQAMRQAVARMLDAVDGR